ncbi:hypothetical protein DW169_21600 [Bacteroides intestinalis]|uniref:Uncharacterized protein n=2 Tax=Bacteroidaceae TaxID=815 RepID=A0A413WZP6_BACUN|nr:hypothetical protein DW873_17935 [Bacteroides uniformis]RHI27078.1 hypothetical protein DW169_21600 [Bacteroides intestinalis]
MHLIDTFSACTGEKPGRYLIPYFSGFCPAWTIREHYYDTKNFREKISSTYIRIHTYIFSEMSK